MNELKFSVSMCVYARDNVENFKTAVNSILNQTKSPDEVVLVVDGPVPDSLDSVIMTYSENPIFHVYRFKENQGHGKARSLGLEKCSYDLVALMDADDISVHKRFEIELAMFEHDPELSIAGGQVSEFISSPDRSESIRKVPLSDKDIKSFMQKRCPMNQPTVMFKKSDIEEVGGYRDWYCNEDYYLWIRLVMAGKKFANSPEILVNMRMSPDSYKRRGGAEYFRSEERIQRLMLHKGLISPYRYFVNVSERAVIQLFLPNKVREWVFKNLARS